MQPNPDNERRGWRGAFMHYDPLRPHLHLRQVQVSCTSPISKNGNGGEVKLDGEVELIFS